MISDHADAVLNQMVVKWAAHLTTTIPGTRLAVRLQNRNVPFSNRQGCEMGRYTCITVVH